jgi:DNA modification methylase
MSPRAATHATASPARHGRERVAAAPWRNRIVGSGEASPGELLANPRNWRTHPPDQRAALAGSLAEVGWVAQVLVNRTTGHVVDGHARIEEAIARGESTVPVLYVELSADEEAVVLATLDPIGAMATADTAKLLELLAEVSVDDAGLARLLAELAGPRVGLVVADEAPEPAAEPYVKTGELYRLGDHRLLCGDATDRNDVARVMEGLEPAELMWTDPPYGVSYEGKTPDRLTLERDTPAESDEVTLRAFELAPLAPSARFYVAAPAGPRHIAFHEAVAAVGWRLHQELVWAKGTIVLGHSDYHYAHEPILYGYVPGEGRPGRGAHEGTRWYGDHSQSSVLEYPKPAANRLHPTAKPVGLVAQCVANSSARGDLIYEPFAGSGSTLIACEELGRRCAAIEIDPAYAQGILERWQAFTGRTAERIVG